MQKCLFVVITAALSLLAVTYVGAENNNNNNSDVAEKFRQLLGVECGSFKECVDLIKANRFQLVFQRLAKYNVTSSVDNKTDIQTISVPTISLPPFNLTGNKQAERGLKLLALLTSIDLETLKKAKNIFKIKLENFRIRAHGLSIDLTNPATNEYSAFVNATSINVTLSLDVSGESGKILSAPFTVGMMSPSLMLHTTLSSVKSEEEGKEDYLKVSMCHSEINFTKFMLSTKEVKLMRLTQFLTDMMNQIERSTLGAMFCKRYQPKLNQLLRKMAGRAAHSSM